MLFAANFAPPADCTRKGACKTGNHLSSASRRLDQILAGAQPGFPFMLGCAGLLRQAGLEADVAARLGVRQCPGPKGDDAVKAVRTNGGLMGSSALPATVTLLDRAHCPSARHARRKPEWVRHPGLANMVMWPFNSTNRSDVWWNRERYIRYYQGCRQPEFQRTSGRYLPTCAAAAMPVVPPPPPPVAQTPGTIALS